MSFDARYLLHYETQGYEKPTPHQKDVDLLLKEIESLEISDFIFIDHGDTIFFRMPRGLLPEEVKELLKADQILERLDGGFWEIIK